MKLRKLNSFILFRQGIYRSLIIILVTIYLLIFNCVFAQSNDKILISGVGIEATVNHHIGNFKDNFILKEVEDGIWELSYEILNTQPELIEPISINLFFPSKEIQGVWTPNNVYKKIAFAGWEHSGGYSTGISSSAPVLAFYTNASQNRLTLSSSELIRMGKVRFANDHKKIGFAIGFDLFQDRLEVLKEYKVSILIDTRPLNLAKALNDTYRWWVHSKGLAIKDASKAWTPFYQTWYSFDKNLSQKGLAAQLEQAKKLGMGGVIIDDGWSKIGRALKAYYELSYAGDWQLDREKFPNFGQLITKNNQDDFSTLLWMSVPMAGHFTKLAEDMSGMDLYNLPWAKATILDPRFPEVREEIIQNTLEVLDGLNPSGLKLDFIGLMNKPKDDPAYIFAKGGGRDHEGIGTSIYEMLKRLSQAIDSINGEALIEYRQPYTNPITHQFANMLRASDCPNGAVENRVRTLDIRLLSNKTAVHSDMIEWHPEEPVQHAALQLINVFFAVPQISVDLLAQSEAHIDMIRFVLRKWNEYKQTLINGELEVYNPESFYSRVDLTGSEEKVVGLFQNNFLDITKSFSGNKILVLNATPFEKVSISPNGKWKYKIFSCTGSEVSKGVLARVGQILEVPTAGMIELYR